MTLRKKVVDDTVEKGEYAGSQHFLFLPKCFLHCQFFLTNCYDRPLLQAWLLPDLNTIPDSCVSENSL